MNLRVMKWESRLQGSKD